MSSIEDVIERSRQPGEFSERKKFSVARSRAIQKLRQFALADPSHYVLEWIQAAVANGATYLDLAIEDTEVRMSYVGGGFSRDELEALFDFLFASKDNLDVADVRQLALGVNALLHAQPDTIVIESGDGTLEGTTRVELDGASDAVYVGRPTRPLEGTFIRADGLRREWGDPKELRAIEERCLTATIPILVNDQPLFGYSAVRSPDLFGYRRYLKFDEGDLYGTIGLATTPITKNFKLLTWGTWITTQRHEFPGLPAMGGVIGYDRLRKTADHASIVKDEVYEEMWARLHTYARQLDSGKTGTATLDVALLDGSKLTAMEYRALVRERGRAVVFTHGAVGDDEARALAARYGEAFDAPVFVVAERDLEAVQHLGGSDVEVQTPRLDPTELRFFERPLAAEPARPWLTAAVPVPELDANRIANWLEIVGVGTATASAARALRGGASVAATVFTPAATSRDTELIVDVRVSGRTVWNGSIESAYPGHTIVVNLQDFPLRLLEADAAVTPLIARAVADQSEPQLAESTERVVNAIRPGTHLSSAARRIILGVISRGAIKRLRRERDGVALRFALESDALPDALLDFAVLETVAGRTLSIRELERELPATAGIVFLARDTSSIPDDCDRSRILSVDESAERMLRSLFGAQSCVTLDSDRVLASHGDLVCGSFHAGLRPAPDLPLLVRGTPPTDESAKRQAVEELAAQLLFVWRRDPASTHALRHLIWFVVHGCGAVHDDVASQPLFRTAEGGRASFDEIRPLLESAAGLPMYDGWSSEFAVAAVEDAGASNADKPLAMDPFVFHALSKVGNIRPILDVDLTTAEAERNPSTPAVAFLEQEELTGELAGVIGLPMRRVEEPLVLWLDREAGTAEALRDLGREYGVVGRIHGSARLERHDVQRRCIAACIQMYDRLIRRIPAISADDEQFSRALEAVLDFSVHRIRITESPDSSLAVTVVDATALRILDLPVFPTTAGVAVTPWRMLREFVTFGDRRPRPGRAVLATDAPPVLRQWLDFVLDRSRIAPHPTASPSVGPPSELDRWLTAALEELRTDDAEGPIDVRVLTGQQFAMWTNQFGLSATDLFVDGRAVYVSEESWLVHGLLETTEPTREAASWLLLAIYAEINTLRLSVTNMHELHFQSRILDWLGR